MTKTERATYTVRCQRSGDWWAITVPEVPGAFSQTRRLDQAEHMAREVISLMLNIPENAFSLVIEPVIPDELLAEIERAKELRQQAEQIQREAGSAAATAVRDLVHRCHLSLRDVGQLVGLSHQRVQQILERDEQTAPT